MIVNFKKLETYRPEIKLIESGTTIGSIVRWQRKRKNMTLNEGAEGICSISYLSKVENNLIEPSEQILDDLKKRFDLESLLNYDLKRYEEDYNHIVESLFYDKEIPSIYFKIYESNSDYKSKLVLFSYYLSRKNLIRAKSIYKDLEFEISKFNHNEINFFYLQTAIMLIEEGRYYLALKVLKLSKVINENSTLSMTIDYYKVDLKLKLGKFMKAFDLSENLEKRLIKNDNIERYRKLLKLKLFYSVNEYEYEFSINQIDKHQYISKRDKEKIKTFLKLNHNQKINNSVMEKNIHDSNRWYLMALLHFDSCENYEKIKEIMDKSTRFSSNAINQQVEFFLDSKYNLDSDSFTRYVRNMTTNFENNYNGSYLISILLENASNYYENKAFYKSANSIRKYARELALNLKRMT
ncbi:MAG: helix-turn-helix domain-containing protein [Acholeplasmataceae bacterium]